MPFETINPATGQKVKSFAETSDKEIERSLQEADVAFPEWRLADFSRRAARLYAAAKLLRNGRDEYAELMAVEMGKPLSQGQSEIEKCAWACEHFAEHASKFLARELVATDAAKSFVS